MMQVVLENKEVLNVKTYEDREDLLGLMVRGFIL